MGLLFSGVSQPLCFANRRGVFRPVNFSALPQFKKSLPPTALRAFWLVLTLSNAAGSSPLRPLLLAAGAGVRGTFLLGVAFRPARGFPGDWKLPLIRLPSRDGSPSLVPLSPFSIFSTLVLPPFEDNGLLFWAPNVRC